MSMEKTTTIDMIMREKKRCRNQHISNEMSMERIHNEYGVDEKKQMDIGYDEDGD